MNHLNPFVHHMMPTDDPEAWPAEIRAIFVAIGDAMNGNRLAPETLAALSSEHGSVIAGHHVSVAHLSAEEIRQRRGCYVVTIDGPQVHRSTEHGAWSLARYSLSTAARRASILLAAISARSTEAFMLATGPGVEFDLAV